MAYEYDNERPKLFTESGVEILLAMQDRARKLCASSGVVRLDRLTEGLSGDSWVMLAAADYLCEKDRMVEVSAPGVMGQHRVFEWLGD